ncbi:MAG: hypothetical protein WDM96_02670 [Lacunisphaera sp.]
MPITRQMREVAYELSPAFAKLRPHLEGAVAEHWLERTLYPAADRQIRGGWMMWALRDAVHEAGLAPDAGAAMRYYRQVADEMNAACDAGRVPARPRRSGFLPPLDPSLVKPLFDETVTYASFFFLFRNFSAYSPDSVGDYADLKPFRNLVGTRLSHAPRSPELPTPEQDRRDAWRLDLLQRIGQALAQGTQLARTAAPAGRPRARRRERARAAAFLRPRTRGCAAPLVPGLPRHQHSRPGHVVLQHEPGRDGGGLPAVPARARRHRCRCRRRVALAGGGRRRARAGCSPRHRRAARGWRRPASRSSCSARGWRRFISSPATYPTTTSGSSKRSRSSRPG